MLFRSNLANLVELDFSGSTFTYVECPQSESMKVFNCSNTKLDIFNVAGFPNLEELYASGSMILTLDISQNNKLKKLTCDRAQLKKLDMPTDPQLEYIDIHNNHLLLDGIKKFVEALNDRTGLSEGTLRSIVASLLSEASRISRSGHWDMSRAVRLLA